MGGDLVFGWGGILVGFPWTTRTPENASEVELIRDASPKNRHPGLLEYLVQMFE